MGASFPVPTQSLQASVVFSAHQHGLIAVAHALCLSDTIDILSAGVDGLTHTFYDEPPAPELVAAYKKNNAFCIPTLACIGSLTIEEKDLTKKFAEDERVAKRLTEEGKDNLCRCLGFTTPSSKAEYAYESVRQLKAAGVDILW